MRISESHEPSKTAFRSFFTRRAAGYIRDEWTAQGYAVREQGYEVGGLRCANLEVAVAGDDGGPVIVIGAHYDSVQGSPGADDNASGVATLPGLSRLFAGKPDLRLRFVAFVNEEPPFFMTPLQGSEVYARQLHLLRHKARRRHRDLIEAVLLVCFLLSSRGV